MFAPVLLEVNLTAIAPESCSNGHIQVTATLFMRCRRPPIRRGDRMSHERGWVPQKDFFHGQVH